MDQIIQFVGSLQTSNRVGKDAARTFATRTIHRHAVRRQWSVIKVLSLPSAWWKFEGELGARCCIKAHNKSYGFRVKPIFTGCERNWKVFCLGSIRIPARGDSPLHQKLDPELNCQVVTNNNDRTLIHADIFDYMAYVSSSPTPEKFHAMWLDTCSPIDRISDKLKYIPSALHDDGVVILTVLKCREAKPLPMERLQYIDHLFSQLDMHRKSVIEYNDTVPMLQLSYGKNSTASKCQNHQAKAA